MLTFISGLEKKPILYLTFSDNNYIHVLVLEIWNFAHLYMYTAFTIRFQWTFCTAL